MRKKSDQTPSHIKKDLASNTEIAFSERAQTYHANKARRMKDLIRIKAQLTISYDRVLPKFPSTILHHNVE